MPPNVIGSRRLPPTSVLVKVHAVSINIRDANLAHDEDPVPQCDDIVPCSDAACEVVALGTQVRTLAVGDRVVLVTDTSFLTGREQVKGRARIGIDQDGVLADHLVLEEDKVCELPAHLDWKEASFLPTAGTTAWSAVKGIGVGHTMLIQVSLIALKLARAAGCRVIFVVPSDGILSMIQEKLDKIQEQFPKPPLEIIKATDFADGHWEKSVRDLTNSHGVDLTLHTNRSIKSLMNSIISTRRGGTISQVWWEDKVKSYQPDIFLTFLVERGVTLRGVNAGSKLDMEAFFEVVTAVKMRFDEVIESPFPFESADDAIEYVYERNYPGQLVVDLDGSFDEPDFFGFLTAIAELRALLPPNDGNSKTAVESAGGSADQKGT